jgi:hypothetical protein
MKIPVVIVNCLLAAMLAIEGWTLTQVIDLKVEVASLKTAIMSGHQIAKE